MHATNIVSTPERSRQPPDGLLASLVQSSRAILRRAVGPRATAAWPCLAALCGVFACTVIFFRLNQNLGSVGFLYLVFVVLAAMYGNLWQATVVSVVAVACLDFFFDEPIFSFTVGRLSNWVELGVFEFTALIITQLSNRAHLREMEAVRERRDTTRLYQTARRILLSDDPGDPGDLVASLIREVFDFRQTILFDAVSGRVYQSGIALPEADQQALVQQARSAYLLDADGFQVEADQWFCALRFGVRPVGSLALCGAEVSALIATALASLAAIALERARTLERQCQAEAARQAEQLRTAVLDALAHKFKTPLTVIRTASSGLPAAGDLSELQRELVSLIDQEARTLNGLASRLMGAPKLDPDAFRPQPEPLLFSKLIKAAIQELDRQDDRDRFQIMVPAPEPPVFADRELILTALAQLVDNALKYSVPASPIEVGIDVLRGSVALKVRTQGLVVPSADRERIFERFYRAPGAQRFSGGTGLGLSIVKTIAADHDGTVWAEGEPDRGTVFSFALPVVPGGACEQ
jgi:two-component system sensor histidine kinase KdpD